MYQFYDQVGSRAFYYKCDVDCNGCILRFSSGSTADQSRQQTTQSMVVLFCFGIEKKVKYGVQACMNVADAIHFNYACFY